MQRQNPTATPPARPVRPKAARTRSRRFIDGYLAYLLAQASERISGEFHREVETAGLSVTEWRILSSLSGGARETVGTLSALTLTKQPTLSKVIQRMEGQGLAARTAAVLDKRLTLVELTAEGEQLASTHQQRALAHQQRVMKPLGAKDARQLIAVLRRLLELPR